MGYLDTLMAQMTAAPTAAGTRPRPRPMPTATNPSGVRGGGGMLADLLKKRELPGTIDPATAARAGQAMPGMTRSGQPQVSSYEENPYMTPRAPANPQDPSKAYWGGWFDDILGSGAGGRGTSPFSLGPQRRQQAEAYNRGETPQQLAMNKMQYDRWEQQNTRKTKRGEKDTKLRNLTNAYVDALKSGKFKGGISEWLTLDDGDRSDIISGTAGRDPSSIQGEIGDMVKWRRITLDPDATEEEKAEAQFQMDQMTSLKRAVKTVKDDNVTRVWNPQTSSWDTIEKGKTAAELRNQSNLHAADREAGITQAQKTAGYNVEMDMKLRNNINSVSKQLDGLYELKERIANGPATGQLEQLGKAFDAEKQAMEGTFHAATWNKVIDMKESGMTFGSFTEKEYDRIAATLGRMGNKKEANMIIIEQAIEDMERAYDVYFERHNDPERFMSKKLQRRTPGVRRKREGLMGELDAIVAGDDE